MKKYKNNKGFTILEMVISMTVISVMVALASPSFSEFVKNNKVYSSSKILNADVSYAKSEGMRGIGTVVLRAINDDNMTEGWRIFVDVDGNNQYDEGSDTLLRIQNAFGNPLVVKIEGQEFISFNSYGENASGAEIALSICDNRTGPFGRVTTVNSAGLVKYAEIDC